VIVLMSSSRADCSRSPTLQDHGGANDRAAELSRGPGSTQAVRRDQGRRRREPVGGARRDRRGDRPNGSGKTTLFNSILGQIKPTSGSVEFCGEDITGMSPLELSRRGVGRTFQTLQVFVKLSVRDNLIAAAQEFKGTMPGRMFRAARRRAGPSRRRDDRPVPVEARRASAGGKPLLRPAEAIDIAMAFMPAPRLVLLDEPCAGVNPSSSTSCTTGW